ncbi:putative disease resistance protein RGA4 [Triticum urartu]|nr:putative disease resistance protein RGA4 [Triticum urartu]
MDTIERLIDKAHGIIALTKRSSKGDTDTAKDTHTPTTSVPTVKVTGRDDEDRNWISEMLHDVNPSSSNKKCFSVIGVHGISGSGKTTLAQHVCEYEKSAKHFNLVMWIQVTQNYSLHEIFKEMLEAASSMNKRKEPVPSSLDVLEGKLREKIKGKQFLLVLDDIWCNKDAVTKQLPRLLSPLMDGAVGSRILATSRDKAAFSDLGPDVARDVFAIRELDSKVFLDLFMYYALEDPNAEGPDRAELRSIGAEISQKLKGSPLAASTVGAQLRERKNDVQFWREVLDRDLLNETTGALWWSYKQLDEQIRRCFAYCSIFPRRRHLKQDELVRLWVAEGFIHAEEDMEAVGRGYFHKLLATSFVQPAALNQQEELVYSIHDLMHDLAEKAAGGDCFRIENGLRTKVPHDVRHLFVANATLVTKEIFDLENLCSLIIDETNMLEAVNTKFFEEVFKKLRKLRVLVVEATNVNIDLEIPETIGHLMHLRYLSLVIPWAKLLLPKALDKLYHLQVLTFGFSSVKFSPDTNMGNLTNVRHIIGALTISAPYISRLTSLQTFERFKVRKQRGYELSQLMDLNKLRGLLKIRNLGNVKNKREEYDAKLADKKGLTELELSWEGDMTCTPQVQQEVLEALCPPKHLESLLIWNYQSLWYPSWMLSEQNGAPKYLKKLDLSYCEQLGPAPELFEVFINLRELNIAHCNWDHLPANVKDLRWLESLQIINCWYLKSLPELPRSLKKFHLVGDDDVVKSCKLEGHPNWQKLQHVGVQILTLSAIANAGLVRPSADLIEEGETGLQEQNQQSKLRYRTDPADKTTAEKD